MDNLPDNQILVIFGASGDLAKRKLLPALFELFLRGLLPKKLAILGAARTVYSDESYREYQKQNIIKYRKGEAPDPAKLEEFSKLIYYVSFDTDSCEEYAKLKDRIAELRKALGIADNIMYYLGIPPDMHAEIVSCLKENKLNSAKSGWRRVIVEKPFGRDYDSARALNQTLRTAFNEDEIYRIDHYLGKETVQNILVLRFSNGIFEPLWNRNYVEYVEINVSETLGIEGRGKYYDTAGALRDMVQNHLMHLMSFVAMEAPANFEPESLRDEIVKVFHSLRPLTDDAIDKDVVRGQYIAGVVDGQTTTSYRSEKDVAPDSQTETYVGMKFFIDNWRWGGVPFFFHTGKRLGRKTSEVIIHFKSTPQQLFVGQCYGTSCNKLIIRIQPNESISLVFGLKVPGAGFKVKQVSMDFRYDSMAKTYLPEAYERLLLDGMLGDSTLYSRSDALESGWKFIDPIIKRWKQLGAKNLFYYDPLNDGPKEGKDLTAEYENPDCPCKIG